MSILRERSSLCSVHFSVDLKKERLSFAFFFVIDENEKAREGDDDDER